MTASPYVTPAVELRPAARVTMSRMVNRGERAPSRGSKAGPQVKILREPKGPAYPAGKMLVACPELLGEVVARIPEGEVVTIDALRQELARRFDADYTCPMSTGIFYRRLVTENVVPWWRVVKANGKLAATTPAAATRQARLLREEGVEVVAGAVRLA